MIAVDIGANIGFYSLLLARYVTDTGQVWAFEPNPINFRTFQENLKANDYHNVTAVNSAVGAKSEKKILWVSPSHSGDHRIYESCDNNRRSPVSVEVIALDDFFEDAQRVDLIKIDVQGAEGLVLAGMRRILTSNLSLKILMEFWPTGIAQTGYVPEQVLADLQVMGFELEYIDEREKQLVKIKQATDFVSSLETNQWVNVLARS